MEGGCQCGAVRYRWDGPRLALYVCHCRECRAQSASAFGVSVRANRADLTVTTGAPVSWTRRTDSGGALRCWFCPTCGTRLWHESESGDGGISIKGGSLDQPPDLTEAEHIWTSRTLAGVIIPAGAETWPEEPAD